MMDKSFIEIANIIETARTNSCKIIFEELRNMWTEIEAVLSEIDDTNVVEAECIELELIDFENTFIK